MDRISNEKPPDGFSWSGERDLRGNKQPQDPTKYGQKCGSICLMQRKAKRTWALDNARQLRGIFFIEPNDEELKHTMENVRRKLEIPMPAAMPCKTPVNCRGETCRSFGKHKIKCACIVDADESLRIRLEGVPQMYHEDHIAARGRNSLSHYNLVHKLIPMPQALKNTRCEGCSGKRMGNIGENTGIADDESQK